MSQKQKRSYTVRVEMLGRSISETAFFPGEVYVFEDALRWEYKAGLFYIRTKDQEHYFQGHRIEHVCVEEDK